MNPWIDDTNSNVPVLLEDGAIPVTEKTAHAGEDITNDVTVTEQRSDYLNMTASGAVKSSAGVFKGFICNSTSSGTVKFWDNTAGSGAVLLGTITPTAGVFYAIPGAEFGNGLYATIANTLDITVFYK